MLCLNKKVVVGGVKLKKGHKIYLLPYTVCMKATVVNISYACCNIAPNQITKSNILRFHFLGSLAKRFSWSSRAHCCRKLFFQLFRVFKLFTHFSHSINFNVMICCLIRKRPFKCFFGLQANSLHCIHSSAVFCCDEGKQSLAATSLERHLLKLRC